VSVRLQGYWIRSDVFLLVNPRPCTLHYLGQCRDAAKCTHGHDYLLSTEHLEELRINAKKSPCSLLNKGEKGLLARIVVFEPRGLRQAKAVGILNNASGDTLAQEARRVPL
jgi:hypothetical protein